jgi:hypothetical protein
VPSDDLYVAERQWIPSSAELQKSIFEGLRNYIMNSILSNLEQCTGRFLGMTVFPSPTTDKFGSFGFLN